MHYPTAGIDPQLIIIIGIVAGTVVGVAILIGILILICCIRCRMNRLGHQSSFDMPIDQTDGSDSPSSLKKPSPKSSPKHNGGPRVLSSGNSPPDSYSSNELHTYHSEPHRIGSRSSSPVDDVKNGGLANSTFRV